MNLLIKPCLQFISLAIAVLLLSVWLDQGVIAYAGHFPWDQGHDTFTPNPGNPPGPVPVATTAMIRTPIRS